MENEHKGKDVLRGKVINFANCRSVHTDALVKFLRINWTCHELNLTQCGVNDEKLETILNFLIEYPNDITRLILRDNQLTSDSSAKLAEFVSSKKFSLTHLDLSLNRLGNVTFEAVIKELKDCLRLEHLIF